MSHDNLKPWVLRWPLLALAFSIFALPIYFTAAFAAVAGEAYTAWRYDLHEVINVVKARYVR